MGKRIFGALLLAAGLAVATGNPPTLAIGAAAPDFHLQGVDGRTHSLADFAEARALVVIFTAVHCPTAEIYERRIARLYEDFRGRDVAFVAIQPNNPAALRLDEMGYTDLGDSFEDMRARASHRGFRYPFLYDGDVQQVSRSYGPTATPHLFIFDAARRLRYQGRVDDNPREAYVKVQDARLAIEAVLAGAKVPRETASAVGCSIKWAYKQELRQSEARRQTAEPVTLAPVKPEELKALRRNPTGKTLLVSFWATWCGPCIAEFPEIQKIWRMYRKRPFEVVTVATNYPDEEKGVRKVLDEQHASTRNLLFATHEPYASMEAFDPDWNAAVPYTMLIAPDGKVLYKMQGTIDALKLRRAILASFPDSDYVGQHAYWNER
jgi:peroxiredoxin